MSEQFSSLPVYPRRLRAPEREHAQGSARPHGPELCVVEGLAIARADLSYLWALHRAVRNATGHDEGRTAALMVPLPRAAAEDLDEASKEDVIAAIGEVFGPETASELLSSHGVSSAR